MGIKEIKPVTPGQRWRKASLFDEITKKKPEKSLLSYIKNAEVEIILEGLRPSIEVAGTERSTGLSIIKGINMALKPK